MLIVRHRFNVWVRAIALIVTIAFLWQGIVWAYPDISGKTTLAPQGLATSGDKAASFEQFAIRYLKTKLTKEPQSHTLITFRVEWWPAIRAAALKRGLKNTKRPKIKSDTSSLTEGLIEIRFPDGREIIFYNPETQDEDFPQEDDVKVNKYLSVRFPIERISDNASALREYMYREEALWDPAPPRKRDVEDGPPFVVRLSGPPEHIEEAPFNPENSTEFFLDRTSGIPIAGRTVETIGDVRAIIEYLILKRGIDSPLKLKVKYPKLCRLILDRISAHIFRYPLQVHGVAFPKSPWHTLQVEFSTILTLIEKSRVDNITAALKKTGSWKEAAEILTSEITAQELEREARRLSESWYNLRMTISRLDEGMYGGEENLSAICESSRESMEILKKAGDENTRGEKVKSMRKGLGLSMKKFAMRAGLSEETIKRVERGKKGIKESTFDRVFNALAFALGIDVETLREMVFPDEPKEPPARPANQPASPGARGADNTSFGEGVGSRHMQANSIIAFHSLTMVRKGTHYEREFYERAIPEESDKIYNEKIAGAIECLKSLGGGYEKKVRGLEKNTTIVLVDLPTHLLLGGMGRNDAPFYQLTHLGRGRRIIFIPRKAMDDFDISNTEDMRQLATILNHDQTEFDLIGPAKIARTLHEYERQMDEIHEIAKKDDPFDRMRAVEKRIIGWLEKDESMGESLRGEIELKEQELQDRRTFIEESTDGSAGEGYINYVNDTAHLAMQIAYAYQVLKETEKAVEYYGYAKIYFDEVVMTDVALLPIFAQLNVIRILIFERDYDAAGEEFRHLVSTEVGRAPTSEEVLMRHSLVSNILRLKIRDWLHEMTSLLRNHEEDNGDTRDMARASGVIKDMESCVSEFLEKHTELPSIPEGVMEEIKNRTHTVAARIDAIRVYRKMTEKDSSEKWSQEALSRRIGAADSYPGVLNVGGFRVLGEEKSKALARELGVKVTDFIVEKPKTKPKIIRMPAAAKALSERDRERARVDIKHYMKTIESDRVFDVLPTFVETWNWKAVWIVVGIVERDESDRLSAKERAYLAEVKAEAGKVLGITVAEPANPDPTDGQNQVRPGTRGGSAKGGSRDPHYKETYIPGLLAEGPGPLEDVGRAQEMADRLVSTGGTFGNSHMGFFAHGKLPQKRGVTASKAANSTLPRIPKKDMEKIMKPLTVGERLSELLKCRKFQQPGGWSQEKLAERCRKIDPNSKITKQYISGIMTGRIEKPQGPIISLLARGLGVKREVLTKEIYSVAEELSLNAAKAMSESELEKLKPKPLPLIPKKDMEKIMEPLTVGGRLDALLRHRESQQPGEWSQKKLFEKCKEIDKNSKITRDHICRLINGKFRRPRRLTILLLVCALGVKERVFTDGISPTAKFVRRPRLEPHEIIISDLKPLPRNVLKEIRDAKTLGEGIVIARKYRGWSRLFFSRLSGRSLKFLSKLEKNKRKMLPTMELISEMAYFLGVDEDVLAENIEIATLPGESGLQSLPPISEGEMKKIMEPLTVGGRLRELLRCRKFQQPGGWSQEKLAERCRKIDPNSRITQNYISKIMTGKVESPQRPIISLFARALGVEEGVLTEGIFQDAERKEREARIKPERKARREAILKELEKKRQIKAAEREEKLRKQEEKKAKKSDENILTEDIEIAAPAAKKPTPKTVPPAKRIKSIPAAAKGLSEAELETALDNIEHHRTELECDGVFEVLPVLAGLWDWKAVWIAVGMIEEGITKENEFDMLSTKERAYLATVKAEAGKHLKIAVVEPPKEEEPEPGTEDEEGIISSEMEYAIDRASEQDPAAPSAESTGPDRIAKASKAGLARGGTASVIGVLLLALPLLLGMGPHKTFSLTFLSPWVTGLSLLSLIGSMILVREFWLRLRHDINSGLSPLPVMAKLNGSGIIVSSKSDRPDTTTFMFSKKNDAKRQARKKNAKKAHRRKTQGKPKMTGKISVVNGAKISIMREKTPLKKMDLLKAVDQRIIPQLKKIRDLQLFGVATDFTGETSFFASKGFSKQLLLDIILSWAVRSGYIKKDKPIETEKEVEKIAKKFIQDVRSRQGQPIICKEDLVRLNLSELQIPELNITVNLMDHNSILKLNDALRRVRSEKRLIVGESSNAFGFLFAYGLAKEETELLKGRGDTQQRIPITTLIDDDVVSPLAMIVGEAHDDYIIILFRNIGKTFIRRAAAFLYGNLPDADSNELLALFNIHSFQDCLRRRIDIAEELKLTIKAHELGHVSNALYSNISIERTEDLYQKLEEWASSDTELESAISIFPSITELLANLAPQGVYRKVLKVAKEDPNKARRMLQYQRLSALGYVEEGSALLNSRHHEWELPILHRLLNEDTTNLVENLELLLDEMSTFEKINTVFVNLFNVVQSGELNRAVIPDQITFARREVEESITQFSPLDTPYVYRFNEVTSQISIKDGDKRFEFPFIVGILRGRPGHWDSMLVKGANRVMQEGEELLDLACGNGMVSVAMAPRAKNIIACDIDDRSVELTIKNVSLNERSNVEVRQGDLFVPVEGEQFDVITCSPPAMPTPQDHEETIVNQALIHEGGPDGWSLIDRIIPGVPKHLKPGGRFVLVYMEFLGYEKAFASMQEVGLVPEILFEQEVEVKPGGDVDRRKKHIEKTLGYKFIERNDKVFYKTAVIVGRKLLAKAGARKLRKQEGNVRRRPEKYVSTGETDGEAAKIIPRLINALMTWAGSAAVVDEATEKKEKVVLAIDTDLLVPGRKNEMIRLFEKHIMGPLKNIHDSQGSNSDTLKNALKNLVVVSGKGVSLIGSGEQGLPDRLNSMGGVKKENIVIITTGKNLPNFSDFDGTSFITAINVPAVETSAESKSCISPEVFLGIMLFAVTRALSRAPERTVKLDSVKYEVIRNRNTLESEMRNIEKLARDA